MMMRVSLLLASLLLSAVEAADVCFILYQMADNNLEYFLRQDNLELIRSPGIAKDSLTTWVYFDGRDRSGGPLQDVWEKDGSSRITSKYSGSRYLTYNHGFSKMVVDKTLAGEQDGDHPQTVYDFVTHALYDCISKGTSEYFLAFSSHGAGFAGFGSDENKRRERRRKLLQRNESIVNAVRTALERVAGAPSKFDVIAFDACLMSSLVAIEEYADVANYFLASEATEPGHGYAYTQLRNVDSALDIAKDLHWNFIHQRQGISHQAPKTLAIVEMSGFNEFHTAFMDLSSELDMLLRSNNDRDFFSLLQRARASSVAFESYLDNTGSKSDPSAVDIGSFINNFDAQCKPASGSSLRNLLDKASSSYNNMFVARDIGPGTPSATGMHVMWPLRSVYQRNSYLFDYYLMNDRNVNQNANEYFSFLKTYLKSNSPTSSSGTGSVCGSSTSTAHVVATRHGLLLNPSVGDTGTRVTIKSEISPQTDQVSVEYGIDSSPRLTGRHLLALGSTLKPPKKSAALDAIRSHRTRRMSIAGDRSLGRNDYFIIFGGTVNGKYNNATFEATWDRKMLFLGDGENEVLPVYVYNDGNGAMSIPVVYFPRSIPVTKSMIPIGTTLEDAEALGGVTGSLKFGLESSTGKVTTAFSLLTDDTGSVNGTISETPPSAGGSIVPILYVEGSVDGYDYDMFLGGFGISILAWKEGHTINVFLVRAQTYLDTLGASDIIINVLARDFDTNAEQESDLVTFTLDTSDSSSCSALRTALVALATTSGMLYWFW